MKRISTVLLFLLCSQLYAIKGLYVDGFASIIGNTEREDSLLNYAQQNGFTYLALYELHLVHAANNLTTVPTSVPLANFIAKAKTMYGITEVGACAENFWWFDNIASVYNSIHANPNEQIDVYNLEFEFWNTGSVSAGQYYCTTYLTPGGYSCDTSGAFAFYMKELTSMDSLAAIDGTINEIYVGWFNQHQATQMKAKADRILLHSYVNNVNNVYSYAQTRLSYLGNTAGLVDVMPIFSSEPAFLGPWLVTNPEVNTYPMYTTGFGNDVGSWKANINLIGYQWFAFSFMPYGLPLGVEETNWNSNVYPNPFSSEIIIENLNNENVEISIVDMMGHLVYHSNSSANPIQIDLSELSMGFYQLYLIQSDNIITKKLIKP